ncbi:transposase [Ancylobacter dichloromethanicus]
MSEVWKTAAGWAAEKLPGLPETESGIVRRAKADGWSFRSRAAAGGGREYPLAVLPEGARVEFARRQIAAVDLPASFMTDAEAESEAQELSQSAAEQRDARLVILAALDRFTADSGLSRREADAHFCAAYSAGAIEVAPWVRASVKSIARATLFRWRAARKAGETHRLAVDKGAARRNRGALDVANGGAVRNTILAAMAKNSYLSGDHIRAIVVDRFGSTLDVGHAQAPVPSARTFQIVLKRWRETYSAELLALTDPDAFKNRLRVSGRSAHLVSRCNELWTIDASPADVLTKDGRHSVYVAVDVFSRRMIVFVSKTPSSTAVGLLMRRAILEWGVPERVKTDNGSDFVAKFTQRVLAALGIDVELSAPLLALAEGHGRARHRHAAARPHAHASGLCRAFRRGQEGHRGPQGIRPAPRHRRRQGVLGRPDAGRVAGLLRSLGS